MPTGRVSKKVRQYNVYMYGCWLTAAESGNYFQRANVLSKCQ